MPMVMSAHTTVQAPERQCAGTSRSVRRYDARTGAVVARRGESSGGSITGHGREDGVEIVEREFNIGRPREIERRARRRVGHENKFRWST